jgi:hypothetical protein
MAGFVDSSMWAGNELYLERERMGRRREQLVRLVF